MGVVGAADERPRLDVPNPPSPPLLLEREKLFRRIKPRYRELVAGGAEVLADGDDFDADLSFAGVPESCHIAATAVHVGRPFTSVTGGYTCTDTTGAVLDVGTVVLRSKCK